MKDRKDAAYEWFISNHTMYDTRHYNEGKDFVIDAFNSGKKHGDEAIDLLNELMKTITCVNLDMGGNHSYALNHRSNKVITKIKAWLYQKDLKK